MNLATMMNGSVMQKMTENQVAIDTINQLLPGYSYETLSAMLEAETMDDATKLVAGILLWSIVEIAKKKEKSSRDFDTLLKYLHELEGYIWIKTIQWYRMIPDSNVTFHDDLSS